MPAAESTRHAPARRPCRPSSPRGLVGPGRGSGPPAIVHAPYIVTRAGIPSHPRAPSPSSPRRASAPHRATRPGKLTHRGMDQRSTKRTSASLRTVERQLVQEEHSQVGRGSSRGVERPAPTHESRRRDREVGDSWGTDRTAYGGPRPLVPLGGPGCAASSPGPWSPSGLGSTGSQSGSSGAAPALVGQLRPRGNTPALRPLWF
jgi:hypothetical protein